MNASAGGFAAISGLVSLDSVLTAIRRRFPAEIAVCNGAAARAAFRFVRKEMKERADVAAD